MFYPGRQPVAYYICIGTIPPKFVDSPIKFNIAFYSLLLFSCVAQLFVIVRLRIFKFQGKELSVQVTQMNKINKESLFGYFVINKTNLLICKVNNLEWPLSSGYDRLRFEYRYVMQANIYSLL